MGFDDRPPTANALDFLQAPTRVREMIDNPVARPPCPCCGRHCFSQAEHLEEGQEPYLYCSGCDPGLWDGSAPCRCSGEFINRCWAIGRGKVGRPPIGKRKAKVDFNRWYVWIPRRQRWAHVAKRRGVWMYRVSLSGRWLYLTTITPSARAQLEDRFG